ncbi:hypothetical protein FSST1_010504 [Fusarium sambucinum]
MCILIVLRHRCRSCFAVFDPIFISSDVDSWHAFYGDVNNADKIRTKQCLKAKNNTTCEFIDRVHFKDVYCSPDECVECQRKNEERDKTLKRKRPIADAGDEDFSEEID